MPVEFTNPIKFVWPTSLGMNPSDSQKSTVRCPSSYTWKLEDVSASEAGRTEDTVMQKMQLGQVVGLELSWNNIRTADIAAILTAFNHEYLYVTYLDAMAGEFKTAEFYVGNRSAPMYSAKLNVWSNLTFNIIKRSGV